MKSFIFLLFLFSNSLYPAFSQSNLLESVKKNPVEAKNICNKLRNPPAPMHAQTIFHSFKIDLLAFETSIS